MTWAPGEPSVVLDGLAYPESPRWHDGRLWFSDVHDGRVWAMTEDGQAEPVVRMTEQPGGLGWLPDGRLLVVSMLDHALLRLDDDGLTEVCDLERFSLHPWNDMVVTGEGRAYIGNYGYDAERGDEPAGARMVCVEPDGEAWVVAEQLLFPNGAVVVPHELTPLLLVAETFGQRISAYHLEPDGSLSNPRVWADLRPNVPDGICLDAEGALWIADPVYNGVMRVHVDEGIVAWIPTGDRSVYSCALGGSDGRTLFLCTGRSTNPAKTTAMRAGCIEAVRVEVPMA
ncbi:MAG: SMP-30/gluconolactonase/LRE family protein [Acidimicrobiales bacterium]|jgi:sugar lactone lactonase YvrE|nr:SMP-30/gluconolactonase/LRE family protein [Acidimicrobiales bacterium]